MRLKTWNEVDASGYTGDDGPLYRIDTLVFDYDDDGMCLDAEYWCTDDEADIHWFDCFLTSLEEARLYCTTFDEDVAWWTKTHGTGKRFGNVGVEILRMEWNERFGEWVPDYAVSTYDWTDGRDLTEWHDMDVLDPRACRV